MRCRVDSWELLLDVYLREIGNSAMSNRRNYMCNVELYSRKVSRKVTMLHEGSRRIANAVCAGCDVSGLSFTEQYKNNEEELLNF